MIDRPEPAAPRDGLFDQADRLIESLLAANMSTMQVCHRGMRLKIDHWPEAEAPEYASVFRSATPKSPQCPHARVEGWSDTDGEGNVRCMDCGADLQVAGEVRRFSEPIEERPPCPHCGVLSGQVEVHRSGCPNLPPGQVARIESTNVRR